MFEKPLVGHRLGDSLLSLLDRMNEFREDEDQNLDDILAYLDSQEYTDFRSCPDHALAVLQFAEKYELLELWRDSFCHGAGMSEELPFSAEYEVRLSEHDGPVCLQLTGSSSSLVNRKLSLYALISRWTYVSNMLAARSEISWRMTSPVLTWVSHLLLDSI